MNLLYKSYKWRLLMKKAKKNKQSLQRQILLPFLSLFILSGVGLSVVAFQYTVQITTDELTTSMQGDIVQLNNTLDILFNSLEGTIRQESTSVDLRKAKYQKSPILNKFKEITDSNPRIKNIYFGTSDGEMILYPTQDLPSDFDPRVRPWYEKAKANPNEVVWTDPYIDSASKKFTVSITKAISNVGVLSLDITQDSISDLVGNVKIGQTGYAAILDQNGVFLSHPIEDLIGTSAVEEQFYKKMMESEQRSSIDYEYKGEEKILTYAINEATGWKILGTVNKSELEQKGQQIIVPIGIALVLVIILSVLVSLIVTKRITKPLHKLQETMREVESGNLTAEVAIIREDEIGELAQSFNTMILQMRTIMEKVAHISVSVTDVAQTLVASAEENTAASNEVARTMQQIASGASDQTELMEQANTVVHNVSHQTSTIGQQTQEMSVEADNMIQVSNVGLQTVNTLQGHFTQTKTLAGEMEQAVQSLDQRSKSINEIVTRIAEIAGQTNLLALNAAIEAARAGEHGKGFAVVASEVRKLAEQTEYSLQDITSLVSQMQSETTRTVTLITETTDYLDVQGQAVGETEQAFITISNAVEGSQKAIQSIVNSVQTMLQQTDSLVSHTEKITSISQETAAGTEEVSASIEETTASMEQLNKLAEELDSYSVELKKELEKFEI
ncbi:methyl-accepting chemotaxis protein [Bacillus sp. HMF5848]|nr:methyl-accepting chemotaxis protein [Bacillus sp. HMF5848]